MNAVDAKNAPNSSILDQHLMSLLEKTGRDLVPLEEFREREQIQEMARYNGAQKRIRRRELRIKKRKQGDNAATRELRGPSGPTTSGGNAGIGLLMRRRLGRWLVGGKRNLGLG